jgi:N6-adenosine-specific RNA methylase IME4
LKPPKPRTAGAYRVKCASSRAVTPEPRLIPGYSAKPDGFYDEIERAHEGPFLEMFARRARLGDWHYFGDQSLGTAEVAA